MPGKICDILTGVYAGKVASVDNKQEPAILDKGKVICYIFDKDNNPFLQDGKHVKAMISADRLKHTGYYD